MSSPKEQYVSSSPSYPGLLGSEMTWEESYRQRVKKMTRDYVNPNSTRLSHRRSRSADSRPQYNTAATYRDTPGSSREQGRSHQVEGLNIFYPMVDETRARVVYDGMGPQFPSQLPKPVAVDQAYYHPNGSARSPNRPSGQRTGNGGSRTFHTPSGYINPFESSSVRKPAQQSVNPTLVITPKRHDQEFIKNSLIMFGDEVSSVGTGASQQELLQPKRNEQPNDGRKERKERKGLVTLPSNLFHPPATRKLRQNYRGDRPNDRYGDDAAEENENAVEPYIPPPPQIQQRSGSSLRISGSKARSFDEREFVQHGGNGERSYDHRASASRTPLPSTSSFDDRDLLRKVSSPDPPANHGSAPHKSSSANTMTNQRRNQTSSTSRKWKIIPSLSKSRSRSRSPEERRGAFPSPSYFTNGSITPKASSTNFYQDRNSGVDGSNDYKLDHRKPVDPPTRVMTMNHYDSIDEESSRLETSLEKKFNDHLTGPDFSDRDGSSDDFARQEPWDSSFIADEWPSARDSLGYPRSKDNSTRVQFKTSYRSSGTFPHFSTPTTPSTASLTAGSESSEYPSHFDPFTSNLSESEYPMYQRPNAIFQHPQETEKYTGQAPKSPSVERLLPALATQTKTNFGYTATSRLNNPPGLDMSFYTPLKPDAPGTASATPNNDKTPTKYFSKTSPTSVMDMQNPNVRWSDNLEQHPTPRSGGFQRPKSILKTSRLQNYATSNDDCGSDETPTQMRAVRIAEDPSASGDYVTDKGDYFTENANDLAFVDEDGHTLSPISSFDAGVEPHVSATKGTMAFERNIPEEYQRAFAYKKLAYSDYAAAAYTDFIEAVAAVVIQTTVRRFLAKIKIHKLRNERDSPRRLAQHRWSQRAARVGKRHVQMSISTRNLSDVNIHEQSVAATRIQAIFRGWYTRDCIAIDHYCAAIIQTAFRKYRARKAYLVDRQRIIKIQGLARRKKAYDIYATSMYCIVAIQSTFRGYLVRKSFAQNFHQQFHETPEFIKHVAATVIQAQWRCFRCEMAFLRAYENILLVQSIARGWVTRRMIRSWLRSHNIKTNYILRESQQRPKLKSTFSYNLPHGYHNHTAFLRQSIPSPVRKTASDDQTGDEAVLSSAKSDPGAYRHVPKSSTDCLLEKYRMKRDQSLRGESQGFRPIDQPETRQSGTMDSGATGRSFPTNRPTRDGSIALPNISTVSPHRPSSDVGARSFFPYQNSNHSRSMGVSSSNRYAVKMSDVPSNHTSHPNVEVGMANTKPSSSSANSRKSTGQYVLRKSVSHDETGGTPLFTEKMIGSGKTFNSGSAVRSAGRVTHAASFDIGSTQTSSVQPIRDYASDPTAASAKPHIDSSHSTASQLLATWRNREKKSSTDQAIKSPSPQVHDSVAVNASKQADEKNLSKEPKKPTSSQEKQSGPLPSQSTLPAATNNLPRAVSNNKTEESLPSPPEIPFYQRKLRPVNLELQDEKKDDHVGEGNAKSAVSSRSSPLPLEQGRGTTSKVVQARSGDVAPVEEEKSSETKAVENMPPVTFDPHQSKSSVHIEMRMKRSESEQQRIDAMHAVFVRSGLIGRQEKEKISFANTTSAEYEVMRDAEEEYGDTQPSMQGKLYHI